MSTAEYQSEYRKRSYLMRGKVTVDGTGTRRRLQGLYAQGWTFPRLARLGRFDRFHLKALANGDIDRVTTRTAERVAQLARTIGLTWPSGAYATQARNRAVRRGWAPLAAWDDIDDPGDVPRGVDYLAEYGFTDQQDAA